MGENSLFKDVELLVVIGQSFSDFVPREGLPVLPNLQMDIFINEIPIPYSSCTLILNTND